MRKYSGIYWKLRLMVFAIRRWWSKFRWGIEISIDGSMLASIGKGDYVDVLKRGDCIEIRDHHNKLKPFTIRLIPYQPNHGIMVEYVNASGKVGWRTHCDSRKFLNMGIQGCENKA